MTTEGLTHLHERPPIGNLRREPVLSDRQSLTEADPTQSQFPPRHTPGRDTGNRC